MKRKIYNKLLNWKEYGKKPLIVLGARQVGKTYIIDEFCQKEFKNHKKVNLLSDINILNLYNSEQSSIDKYKQLKILLNFDPEEDDSILFIDEAQESESLISDLKFINEQFPKAKIILAGSLLGIQLKRLKKPFPVGKVDFIDLYPFDFEEFLMAKDRNDLIDMIKDCHINNKMMPEMIHELLISIYKEYLIVGGMPENVQSYIDNQQDVSLLNDNILNDINTAYINDMSRYTKSNEESIKIRKIYYSIASQLANNSRKFQYSKIESNARASTHESALNWLIYSGLVNISECVSNPQKPIKGFVQNDVFKVYMSDVALLNKMLNVDYYDIISDNILTYKGVITENYVANQLLSNGIPLNYWRNNNSAEIDFLIENKNGVIPVEVKSSDNKKAKSLNIYIDKYKPEYAIRITSKNYGYNEKTRIKSVPLYSAFMLNDDTNK